MKIFLESLMLINWKMVGVFLIIFCSVPVGFANVCVESENIKLVKLLDKTLPFVLCGMMIFQSTRELININNGHPDSHYMWLSLIITFVGFASYYLFELLAMITWNIRASEIEQKEDDKLPWE